MSKLHCWRRQFKMLLGFEHFEETRDTSRETLLYQPDDGQAWEALGITAWFDENDGEALEALETANTLIPLSIAGQLALADCYRLQGKEELTRLMYGHVCRRPDCPHAHFGIAFYQDRLGASPDEILPYVLRAHVLAPQCWLVRLNLAWLFARQGEFDQAHRLLGIVEINRLTQSFWLERMEFIAQKVGDHSMATACQNRARILQQSSV